MKEPSMPHVEVDLVKGAKRHGRRSGAHERDHDHVGFCLAQKLIAREVVCDYFSRQVVTTCPNHVPVTLLAFPKTHRGPYVKGLHVDPAHPRHRPPNTPGRGRHFRCDPFSPIGSR